MSKKKKYHNLDNIESDLDNKKDVFKEEEKIKESDYRLENKETFKIKKHLGVHLFLMLLLIVSLLFLGISLWNKDTSIQTLITNLLLTLFTILFVVIGISYRRKRKGIIFLCGLLLFIYFILDINNSINLFETPISTIEDFNGKSLTYVVKWASKNNITLNQIYDYSDMVSEYEIISQDIKSGTNMKDVHELTVAVSEGPNPSKEIIVPSMITWNSERVLNYVKENYLSNVKVEFVESEKAIDTVIEQSASGSLKRDDELKLTFSYGEELGYDEVSLIDFTGKSKFEVEFYMKQHQLNYEFDEAFSKLEKRGLAIKQSIKPNDKVKINDESIKVTISKGPEIKIPDLKKMNMMEITEWAIKNKLKLEFTDKYDDSVKKDNVISANFSKGDSTQQGEVIKVVISRGNLKMPKFKSYNDFRDWADKYEIKYEEKREFNDDIPIGEVISYSYKTGQTIKNDDTIIVKISDGKKREVPNLKGLTKSEVISKLKKLDLKYNFIYKASNSVSKDKVISQSISAGSEISSGTTITVTLSNGKKEESSNKNNSSSDNKKTEADDNKNNNSSSNNNGNNNTDNGNNNSSSCEVKTYTVGRGLNNVFNNCSSFNECKNDVISYFATNYPGVKIVVVGVDDAGASGGYVGGDAGPGSTIKSCSTTYTIKLAK